jgi:hypothetical protein
MTWLQFLVYFDEWWGTITFCVAAVFVLAYGLGSPWYRSPFGRSLITLDFGLAVALFPTFLDFVFHINLAQNKTMGVIVVGAACAVTLAISYRLLVLWRVRNEEFWKSLRNTRLKRQGARTDSDT